MNGMSADAAHPQRKLQGIVLTPKSGRARRRELAAEAEAEAREVLAAFLADREDRPTAEQVAVLEEMAMLKVRLRRLRADGRHRQADELSARFIRAARTVERPDDPEPPAPAPRPSALEVLSREAAK